MKKTMMTLIVLILIAGSGWAADNDTTSSPDQTDSDSSVSAPDQSDAESSAATPDIKESESQGAPSEQSSSELAVEPPEETSHSFGHMILLYIPNRILDVFDFARLRVRVGPGFALGARVTKPISFFFGGYGSVYVGLPGPRMEPTVKLPFGIENYGGLSLSLLDSTNEGRFAPNYSPTEIGTSLQFLIVGFDVDVDPVEVLDLALGFLFIDIRGDDL